MSATTLVERNRLAGECQVFTRDEVRHVAYFWPKVRLVARPMLALSDVNDFLQEEFGQDDALPHMIWERDIDHPAGEQLCEFAGRMCYGSFGAKQGRKSTFGYISNIVGHAHGSVLEHANYTFLVTRAGRGFTHQMVRHRAGFAFSQESTHFIDYSEKPAVFSLTGMEPYSAESLEAMHAMVRAVESYSRASLYLKVHGGTGAEKKRRCGTVRAILPNGLQSKLAFTANIRALRHFCELRGAVDNSMDMRAVAVEVCLQMKDLAPAAFEALSVVEDAEGMPWVMNDRPNTRKV